jgi:hypothetical protein
MDVTDLEGFFADIEAEIVASTSEAHTRLLREQLRLFRRTVYGAALMRAAPASADGVPPTPKTKALTAEERRRLEKSCEPLLSFFRANEGKWLTLSAVAERMGSLYTGGTTGLSTRKRELQRLGYRIEGRPTPAKIGGWEYCFVS